MELGTVVSGSAGKRRRNDEDRNDTNSKRSAVMRVCTAGEGSGSDSGSSGSGNGAGGGEVERSDASMHCRRRKKEVGVTRDLVGLATGQGAGLDIV
jgi:hypothetical protein